MEKNNLYTHPIFLGKSQKILMTSAYQQETQLGKLDKTMLLLLSYNWKMFSFRKNQKIITIFT